MNKLLIIIIAIAMLIKFNPSLFEMLDERNGAFHEDGSPKVILFVRSDCGTPCSVAVKHLMKKNVVADIIDINNNNQGSRELKKHTKRDTVPILMVGKNVYYGFHDKRFNELLYEAAGESVLDWQEKKVFKHHFNEDGTAKLVMYGTSWCGYCAQAKKRFEALGIDYIEWDVEKDSLASSRYKILQATGYPFIYVGTRRIGSFDERKIIASLEELNS